MEVKNLSTKALRGGKSFLPNVKSFIGILTVES